MTPSEKVRLLYLKSPSLVIGIPFLHSSPWSRSPTLHIKQKQKIICVYLYTIIINYIHSSSPKPIHKNSILCFPLPLAAKKRFADMNLCHEFTPNITFFDAIRQTHQRNWCSCKGTSTPGDVTEEVKTWRRQQDMSCWNKCPTTCCLIKKKDRGLIMP